MAGYRAGGFLRLLFFLVVFGLVAAVAYQIGVSQATSAVVVGGASGTVAVPVYVGHVGWAWGFGFFWFLIPLFFIFLVFFAIRAATGGHRHRGWGYGPYGPGGPDAPGSGAGPWDSRRQALEDLHRSLHEADAARAATLPTAGPAAGAPPSGTSADGGPSSGPTA
jgi:hypothetical protein